MKSERDLGCLNKKIAIDEQTGEVISEKTWREYDGFSEGGYKYRAKGCFIRYFYDSLPDNYDKDTLLLLFMIAELMNTENVLVYKIKKKSKFSTIKYIAYTKEDIAQHVRFYYGMHKFDRCWNALKEHALKKIRYHDVMVWAVNPSIVSKCRIMPYWLYEEFQDTIDPHLTPFALKRIKSKVNEYYEEENKENYDYDILGLRQ